MHRIHGPSDPFRCLYIRTPSQEGSQMICGPKEGGQKIFNFSFAVPTIVDTVDFPNSETLNFLENNLEIKFLSRVSSRPNSENFLPPKAPILVINANAEPHGKPISLSRPCFETHSDMIGIMCD